MTTFAIRCQHLIALGYVDPHDTAARKRLNSASGLPSSIRGFLMDAGIPQAVAVWNGLGRIDWLSSALLARYYKPTTVTEKR
jgi:hypothetical protein